MFFAERCRNYWHCSKLSGLFQLFCKSPSWSLGFTLCNFVKFAFSQNYYLLLKFFSNFLSNKFSERHLCNSPGVIFLLPSVFANVTWNSLSSCRRHMWNSSVRRSIKSRSHYFYKKRCPIKVAVNWDKSARIPLSKTCVYIQRIEMFFLYSILQKHWNKSIEIFLDMNTSDEPAILVWYGNMLQKCL